MLSVWTVAVAQTPGGLTGAFLRVGSKKPQVVAHPRRALPSLGAASPFSDRHSERSPGFRRRLCATATTSCDSPPSAPGSLLHRTRKSRATAAPAGTLNLRAQTPADELVDVRSRLTRE